MPNLIETIKKSSRNTIITVGVLVIAALLIIAYPLFIKQALANAALNSVIKAQAKMNPAVTEMYAHVKEKEKAFKANENNTVEQYLSLGFSWKSLADQMRPRSDNDGRNPDNDRKYILRYALDVYEAGIKKFKKTNSILYINAANLWRELGDYAQAEKRYLQALELDAGDVSTHLILIDLYKRELNKPVAFVKARYELASKIVLNQFSIALSFAEYTRSLGEYEKSLEFYTALYEADPRPEFKQAIIELKAEIQKKK